MISPLDLLDLPYSYWQLPLLTEQQFCRKLRERDVPLFDRPLEGLHRVRLLIPFLRFKRDGRAIAVAARRNDYEVLTQAHFEPTSRWDLLDAHRQGRLFDPAEEHFIARRRLERNAGDRPYRSSDYLYSEHQLIFAPILRDALPHLTYGGPRGSVDGVDLPGPWLKKWQRRAAGLREISIAASALEPLDYPEIVRHLRSNDAEFERYERWYASLPIRKPLSWLSVKPDWLSQTAASLLEEADATDPLGRWIEVVRAAHPDTWPLLKGDARIAVDLRVRAEMLLRYYERLAQKGQAPKLPEGSRREPSQFARRLGRTTRRDPVLTEFGLSPHPRVLLVLEGETEMAIFPRVMAHFGLRQDREFIAIENAQGVSRDLAPLVAYAVAPKVERDEDGRYLELERPATRMFVLMDPEGPYETEAKRVERREVWTERIMQTIPARDRTKSVRRSVRDLVTVETWDKRGQSFEFAHFTDLQLARAIFSTDERNRWPSAAAVRDPVSRIRAKGGNLDRLLGPVSKLALADSLWPVLERQIALAESKGTEQRIPIVRAVYVAYGMSPRPHGKFVIPLKP